MYIFSLLFHFISQLYFQLFSHLCFHLYFQLFIHLFFNILVVLDTKKPDESGFCSFRKKFSKSQPVK